MQDPRDKKEQRETLGDHFDTAIISKDGIEIQVGLFKKLNGKFQARFGGGVDATKAIAGEEDHSPIMAIKNLMGKL